MRPKELAEEQKRLLIEMKSFYVELELFLAVREANDDDDFSAHREAALLSLKELQEKWDLYFNNLLKTEAYRHREREDFFQISIAPEKLSGQRIDLKTFMGFYYSIERRQAALRGRSSRFLNDYFWVGDEEKESNILDTVSEFKGCTNGYAYGFFEPPYNIHGTALEKQALFHKVEKLFFGKFDYNALIYSWSDNCSNYFNAGKEW